MTADEYRKLIAQHNGVAKTRKRPRHLESDLQIKCVQWFRLTYPKLRYLLFSVPNGGLRSLRTAQILKAEGALAGVSDLILLIARGGYGALCIEMKYGSGKQSAHQRAWQAQAERAGNKYVIVRSIEEFADAIEDYLDEI